MKISPKEEIRVRLIRDKIYVIDRLISQLRKSLSEEEDIISYKKKLASNLEKEINAKFTLVQGSLKILGELKNTIRRQIEAVNNELNDLNKILENISSSENYSEQKLKDTMIAYNVLRSQPLTDKSKLTKLGSNLTRIVKIIGFIKSSKKKSTTFKLNRAMATQMVDLWRKIQKYRKTIEQEIALGGDINLYKTQLNKIRVTLNNQLAITADLIKYLGQLGDLFKTFSQVYEAKDEVVVGLYRELRELYTALIESIENEESQEKELKDVFPLLFNKYQEVKQTIDLEYC
ncbi:hypothetical protein HY483_03485 [Candidatus Woesearchaeota archaeon]|nr:hypothetical protein [Candidatus Woesearchaeota archaeon]